MPKRLLVLGIGVGLLVAAASVVVVITSRDSDETPGDGLLTTAVISNRNIRAHRDLDPLIQRGVLVEIHVPVDALVERAITELEQLSGTRTRNPIRANELILSQQLLRITAP